MVESAQGVGVLLEELKHETFEKWDAFTVGEVFNMKEDELRELSERTVISLRCLIFPRMS